MKNPMGSQVRFINGECLTGWKVLGGRGWGGGSVRAVVVVELGLTSCHFSMRTPKGCFVVLFIEEKGII